MPFIIILRPIQPKTFDGIRYRPTLAPLLRLTTRLKPRILIHIKRVPSHLLAVFERVDVKDPARIHAIFYLSNLTILLVPHARVICVGVIIVGMTDEPIDAVGEVKLFRVREACATVLGSCGVGL
jgi:hypothetical protein